MRNAGYKVQCRYSIRIPNVKMEKVKLFIFFFLVLCIQLVRKLIGFFLLIIYTEN